MSGARGEHRGNALWGRSGRRACIALAVLACALAAAAGATAGGGKAGGADALKLKAYVQPSLVGAIQQSPSQSFDVIVQGDPRGKSSGLLKRVQQDTSGTGDDVSAAQVHAQFRSIDGLHATLTGSQILRLARRGSVAAILPNETVRSSSVALPVSNGQKWAWSTGVPVDWTTPALGLSAPTIAIVDSGVDPPRPPTSRRTFARQVDLYQPAAARIRTATGSATARWSQASHHSASPTPTPAPRRGANIRLARRASRHRETGHRRATTIAASRLDPPRTRTPTTSRSRTSRSARGASARACSTTRSTRRSRSSGSTGVTVVAAAGELRDARRPERRRHPAPDDDPFVITVGAADTRTILA